MRAKKVIARPVRPPKREAGLCVHCRHARPVERKNPHNPLVIECGIDGERQVARVHHCKINHYEEADGRVAEEPSSGDA